MFSAFNNGKLLLFIFSYPQINQILYQLREIKSEDFSAFGKEGSAGESWDGIDLEAFWSIFRDDYVDTSVLSTSDGLISTKSYILDLSGHTLIITSRTDLCCQIIVFVFKIKFFAFRWYDLNDR